MGFILNTRGFRDTVQNNWTLFLRAAKEPQPYLKPVGATDP